MSCGEVFRSAGRSISEVETSWMVHGPWPSTLNVQVSQY